jgi:uncharacterized protein (DUF302 family)
MSTEQRRHPAAQGALRRACPKCRLAVAAAGFQHRRGRGGDEMFRALTFAILASFGAAAVAADQHPVVTYSKAAKFEDVRDDLKAAIEGKGLVIDYHSFVNKMLERTGKDVGSAKKLYLDAQSFVFCSATLSRKTMEADPANVAMCPYSMVVYATAQEPGKVYVAYRRPWRPDGSAASKAALAEVDSLLDSLAREALGLK